MGFFDSLLGPPNIDKLKTDRNLDGLGKALRNNKKWEVRLKAVAALGEIGGPEVLPVLVSSLGDATSQVRRAAAMALGTIGDRRVVAPLTALVAEEERLAAEWAREALGSVIGAGPVGSSQFIEGVHRERGVRQAALDALGRIERGGRA